MDVKASDQIIMTIELLPLIAFLTQFDHFGKIEIDATQLTQIPLMTFM